MKTAAALLALALPAAAQIVGSPVGTGWPVLQFGQPTAGGFLTTIAPVRDSSAAWCGMALGLAPSPLTLPGFAGAAYIDPAALGVFVPLAVSSSGVEWLYRHNLPAGASTLGVIVGTQLVLLTPTGYALSQGWTVTLQ